MVEKSFIPVYKPDLSGNEALYLKECVDTGWISSSGKFIDEFETQFAKYTGAAHAITVANGTVALHLALEGLGLGKGDEVLVPTFTYIASVNAIRMCGATPVFVEARHEDWLIDPIDLVQHITKNTKAIMPVHLYSGMCDMPQICAFAENHNLLVIEDAAEAFGNTRNGQHAGCFGDVASFSFFGNKTITTGEGGMVTCKDPLRANLMRRLKSQGIMENPTRLDQRYWHDLFAFNYRMNNVTAAIGVAQLERATDTIRRKQEIATIYHDAFSNLPVEFQFLPETVSSAHWLVSFLLPPGLDREAVMVRMNDEFAIQTRPVFFCAHQMPVFERKDQAFPISEDIARRGISIPSYPGLNEYEIGRVIDAVTTCVKQGPFSTGSGS